MVKAELQIKLAAVILAGAMIFSPVSMAEEMSPSFSQKDIPFSMHGKLGGLNQYPSIAQIETSGALVQKTNDTCSDPGEKDGHFSCIKQFSNGVAVTMTTDQEHFGEDFKRQVVIAEFNNRKELTARQTVRQKTVFKTVKGERRVSKEFFDVVNRPQGKKITREIVIYEYDLSTGMARNISWTSYEQIGDSAFAMITRHVALTFDEDGKPLMGRAEKWKNEVPVENLFHWDRMVDGSRALDMTSWETWKTQIFNASPRQIF